MSSTSISSNGGLVVYIAELKVAWDTDNGNSNSLAASLVIVFKLWYAIDYIDMLGH